MERGPDLASGFDEIKKIDFALDFFKKLSSEVPMVHSRGNCRQLEQAPDRTFHNAFLKYIKFVDQTVVRLLNAWEMFGHSGNIFSVCVVCLVRRYLLFFI